MWAKWFRMKVALLYNPRPSDSPPASSDDAFEEYDSPATIAAILGALRRLRLEVHPVIADSSMPRGLETGGYDFAFNIAEGRGRRCREAIAAAVCELFDLPYTGSDPLTLAATLDKSVARRLVAPDVAVAQAVLLTREEDEKDLDRLTFPVVVKPNDEGSSKGIRDNSIADCRAEAIVCSRHVRDLYECPVLVEEFLCGAEITVGIIGNGEEASILGAMEIAPLVDDSTRPFIYSIDAKRNWRNRVRYHIPPRLSAGEVTSVESKALAAYRLLGCRDFARMDFRFDAAGRPCFLECNPLPGLDPENSDVVLLSRDHIPYDKLVQRILLEAMKRTRVRLS
jgi:D-alanine-D-alanine ligase